MSPSDAEDQLRALQRGYVERLPQRAHELRERADALISRWDEVEALELQRLAHNLAGSGATYGFPEVSAAARKLERALDSAPANTPPATTLAEIQAAVEGLFAVVGALPRT